MSLFKALVLQQGDDAVTADIRELSPDQLPVGDVEIAVEYSSLNYKDGLVLNGLGGLVKDYPHVPGIDYAALSPTAVTRTLKKAIALLAPVFASARYAGVAMRSRSASAVTGSCPCLKI